MAGERWDLNREPLFNLFYQEGIIRSCKSATWDVCPLEYAWDCFGNTNAVSRYPTPWTNKMWAEILISFVCCSVILPAVYVYDISCCNLIFLKNENYRVYLHNLCHSMPLSLFSRVFTFAQLETCQKVNEKGGFLGKQQDGFRIPSLSSNLPRSLNSSFICIATGKKHFLNDSLRKEFGKF